MSDNEAAADAATIRRYLLGQLAEEEQRQLEERLFTDDAYFVRVELGEDELIEAYARGELGASERDRFERHFLSTPARQQNLALTRYLRDLYATAARPQPTRWWRSPWILPARSATPWLVPMAASVVLLLGAIGYLAQQLAVHRTTAAKREQSLQQQLAGQQARLEQLSEQLRRDGQRRAPGLPEPMRQAKARPPRSPAPLSFLLTPNLVVRGQGGEGTSLALPSKPIPVQLQLDLELEGDAPYVRYRSVLQTEAGAQVWSHDGLRARGTGADRRLVLRLPAGLLHPGGYRLQVSGVTATGTVEELDNYPFRVIAR